MLKIFNKGEEGDIVRYRRKENIYMIWEFLFSRKNIITNPTLKKCLEYRLEEFKELEVIAKSKGFLLVSSSPLTRSSYHADKDFVMLKKNRINQINAQSIS